MNIYIKHLFQLLGERMSRRALEYYAIQKILSPVDNLLAWVMSSSVPSQVYYPPIFIIGAPRSGSTLLYQYLSLVLDVSYISNMWAIFPRSGSHMFPGKTVPPVDFNSFYGNSAFLFGAHEGGSIFTQWFPDKDQHFTSAIPDLAKRGMRTYFETVSSIGKRPWLTKNVRNSMRIQVLKDVFPEGVYIRLKRDPLLIAQSIIEGRYKLTGSLENNFTVMPKEWESIRTLPYPRQVAQQVYYIEAQTDNDLADVPAERVINCDYDAFCSAPFEFAVEVCKRWQFVHLRSDIPETVKNKTFKVSRSIRLSSNILDQITGEFERIKTESPSKIS
ncbi:MAG: sulfotransferase [Anaerolineales bacterium]